MRRAKIASPSRAPTSWSMTSVVMGFLSREIL
jgi:hypothetical protein